jgi:hypothetical protein
MFENSTLSAPGKKFAHQAENLSLLLLLVESDKSCGLTSVSNSLLDTEDRCHTLHLTFTGIIVLFFISLQKLNYST